MQAGVFTSKDHKLKKNALKIVEKLNQSEDIYVCMYFNAIHLQTYVIKIAKRGTVDLFAVCSLV